MSLVMCAHAVVKSRIVISFLIPPPECGSKPPHSIRSFRVPVDDARDRALTHFAEPDFIAREHHAVGLRTEQPLRLVARPFESADLAGVLLIAIEELRLPHLLLAEERIHLRLRTVLRADLAAPRLDLAAVLLELFLVPRRRQRH